ncbi:MAG: DNA-directed RNA polymerase subunit omega [Lachnospiraceae bacterium]|nr:DNA-directed RNA polymerase subunit omega [Lachnospiraceae bacterium]
MLHPSYAELMDVVNSDVEPGERPVAKSRYSIVMATAKRAREMVEWKWASNTQNAYNQQQIKGDHEESKKEKVSKRDNDRAEMILAHVSPLVEDTAQKPLSIAVEELYEGKVRIVAED